MRKSLGSGLFCSTEKKRILFTSPLLSLFPNHLYLLAKRLLAPTRQRTPESSAVPFDCRGLMSLQLTLQLKPAILSFFRFFRSTKRFVGLMEKHGFIVLTEVGAIRKAYLEFMQLLKAFFEGDSDWKETKKGRVHFNERGIPMVKEQSCRQQRRAWRCDPSSFCDPSMSPVYTLSLIHI